MTEHSLEQTLSALMDGEASELELRRILHNLDDPAVRQRWQQLNQLRFAMHQEPFAAVDVSAGVMAALDEEQPVAVPKEGKEGAGWSGWQRLAVAASVTLAVLGGVKLYNQDPLQQGTPAMAALEQRTTPEPISVPAMQIRNQPVVLASHGGPQPVTREVQHGEQPSDWHRLQLPQYLKQHAQHTGAGAAGATLPYARAASMEGR